MPGYKTILVISNENLLFQKLSRLLTQAGYELKPAFSGDSALKSQILKLAPQVIVIDPEVPGMKGVQLSLLVRQWSPAPILLISPSQCEPDEIRLLDVTAKGWMSEPLSVELVAVRVSSLV
ncbi:MAG TPA: response regulator [Dehalococcoidales bacterium]|nr:response regulator [Dehalococcoidales bacterium]